ncbi:hypothetical protein H5410_001798 [Solanum commersonii]|uniref:Uncharacterized protein n=1 Tax=Solanum commersonii TaxID=4109 RepID=A0A9J6B062_SOLCO|nr:hypothetical protein H5410_001798 [Solanum commersonii]
MEGNKEHVGEKIMSINYDERTNIEWTANLHEKFKEATQRLGCLPKEILEIMNVPGLTRMHVANYLQRCCINQRRPLEEQKYIRQGSSSGSQQRIERSSHRIVGRIPDLQTNVSNQTHGDPKFSPVNTNNIYASSTEQQLYHPQLNVQQHYLSPFLSVQNNDGGRLQQ